MNISKILFVIGAIVCLPLYGFLCITNLDPTTGFFSSSNLLTTVFYGVLIAVPVLIILLSTVIQKRFAFSISNSRMLGVLSLLMGALMIASGVIHLMNLLSSAFSAVMFSTLIITALQIVMAALSGIVFLQLGICYFKENISNRGSLTFLFPLVWALIACVEMFRDYPQIARNARTYPLSAVSAELHPLPDGSEPHLERCRLYQGSSLDQCFWHVCCTVRTYHDCRRDCRIFFDEPACLRCAAGIHPLSVLLGIFL